jgi:putative hemolysin
LLIAWTCTAVSSAFNAVERTRVEDAAKGGDHRASIVLKLLDNPPRSLAPVSFINMLAIASLASTATWRAIEGRTQSGVWTAELVPLLLVWILGSFVSFMVAASRALTVVQLAAQPMALLLTLAAPFMTLGAWLARQAKGSQPIGRGSERVTSDDIQIIVAEGSEERKLDEIAPEERKMIAGIIEMGGRTARDIMIPRPDVIGIEVGAPLDQALDIAAKYGHSRLPVYEEDLDHIVGILHVKDLIQGLRHPHREVSLRQLLRPVHYVPDTAKADDLLRDLLRNRVHMAVVVDEYGGTAGVVTIEDALEEIVGEIRDEYDAAEEPEYVRVNENEALFNARVPVSEVNDVLSIKLPTEESDTLGGLVYTRLGRMPKTGDHVEVDSIELTVTAVVGRRIKQVRVRNLHSNEEGETVANDT